MSQTTLFSLLCFMMIISHFSLIHRGLRRRARYSYDQVSVGNDTMEYPPSRHINTTLASKLCLITYFGFLSDKAIFNWAFKAILDCFGWFYSVMWLFQKIHITFWTNQMQNLNQSQLGHSPSPALSAVWYFPCYDWLFWLLVLVFQNLIKKCSNWERKNRCKVQENLVWYTVTWNIQMRNICFSTQCTDL